MPWWAWVLGSVALLGLAWLFVWHVMFGDNLASTGLVVVDGPGASPRLMEIRFAPRLPNRLGHDYVSLGGVIRTRLLEAAHFPEKHLPSMRHEAHHGYQQSRWPHWGLWLAWYLVNPRFRKSEEADAHAHEQAEWPKVWVG